MTRPRACGMRSTRATPRRSRPPRGTCSRAWPTTRRSSGARGLARADARAEADAHPEASSVARRGGYAPSVTLPPPLRIALAQIAPRLGAARRRTSPATTSCSARPARSGAGLVVFPELGLTGYLLQDLAAEVAIRLDDPRLAGLAAATDGPVGGRLVRRGVGRPSPVHRRGAARGRRDPARPPEAVPADVRPVRRAAVLRRGRSSCGRRRRGSGSGIGIAICEDFWHLTVPAAARPRRRPDPDQRLVVARSRPRGDATRSGSGRRRRGGR